ncbi:MAG: bifunctional homocysteine S-methyltransferase/methylenetetrahydrofolate reductase [Oscillospiraceae bacterium]|jgi:methionine synthase I (cobalamin-dependent)/5,10-methylenetetrahydrofolate reductase
MSFPKGLGDMPLLFDGGMGSYYAQKYGFDPECCERANLQYPERVSAIHREYIAAGARAVKTNTFGANSVGLECSGETVAEIIDAGWRIAKAAAGEGVSVFADVGPIPHAENVRNLPQYLAIAEQFLKLGAENFLFETFSSDEDLHEIAAYIKAKKPDAFVVCSFAVSPDGFTREGMPLSRLRGAMEGDANVDAWGLNCLSGPNHMIKLLAQLAGVKKPLIAMPNAGYPTLVGSRVFYANNADYYAHGLADIAALPEVQMVGGCCGTTPEHIQNVAALLGKGAEKRTVSVTFGAAPAEASPNRLWDKLESGKKVIAVELDPPADSDIRKFMDGARALRDAGADAVTIADCPISRARADSSLLAAKLRRELDIDPIPHMTCRDRNIIATKALLLGLNIEGVRNVLVVTGDPVPTAERGTIKSVFNFNSVVLANYIRELAPELSCGPFRVFGALNINALNFDHQLRRAQEKEKNGVEGFLTQPVHSERALKNLRIARQTLKGRLLGGVMPIVSYRNACYMDSEIAGMSISPEIIRMYEGLDRTEATELAVSLTTDFAKRMADFVDGWYIITPFSRTDIVTRVIDNLR